MEKGTSGRVHVERVQPEKLGMKMELQGNQFQTATRVKYTAEEVNPAYSLLHHVSFPSILRKSIDT